MFYEKQCILTSQKILKCICLHSWVAQSDLANVNGSANIYFSRKIITRVEKPMKPIRLSTHQLAVIQTS